MGVFDIVSTHIDHFWRTMLEKGWKFDETTNLRKLCFMVEVIAKDRFSINTIRKEIFDLKQEKNENPMEYLDKTQQLMGTSDWYNISATEAICLIFQIGVKCANSRQICSKLMKQFPEGDIHKLCDQLKVVDALKNREPQDNCMSCGKQGHTTPNCWGKCPACGGYDHRAGHSQISLEEAKRKKIKKRRKKYRLRR